MSNEQSANAVEYWLIAHCSLLIDPEMYALPVVDRVALFAQQDLVPLGEPALHLDHITPSRSHLDRPPPRSPAVHHEHAGAAVLVRDGVRGGADHALDARDLDPHVGALAEGDALGEALDPHV